MFLALCIAEKPLYIALYLYTTHKCCTYWTELAITKQKLCSSKHRKVDCCLGLWKCSQHRPLTKQYYFLFLLCWKRHYWRVRCLTVTFCLFSYAMQISKNVLQFIDSKSSTDLTLLTLKSIEPLFKPISHIRLYLKLIKVENIELLFRKRILAVCSAVNRLHFYATEKHN